MPPPISTSPRPWRRSLTRSRSGTRSTKHPSKAEWHIPRAHYLESWGDARAVGGTLSVVQPLILPLFGGRTAVEVLGLMVGGKDRPGYEIVRETWKPILGEGEFDRQWNRVLHDGLLAGSELPEVVPELTAQPLAELARLIGARRLPTGRGGIAGWPGDRVRPLPVASRRPIRERRVAAGASRSPHQAHLGQSRAREPEDRRNARSGERGCDPSQSCGPLARASRLDPPRHGGRRGRPHPRLRSSARGADWSGVGFDTFTVRPSKAPGFDSGVRLTKLGRTYPLSATQDHGSMEGRPLVRESTVAELRSEAAAPAQPRANEKEGAPGALGVFPEETEHSPSGRSTPTIRATSGG